MNKVFCIKKKPSKDITPASLGRPDAQAFEVEAPLNYMRKVGGIGGGSGTLIWALYTEINLQRSFCSRTYCARVSMLHIEERPPRNQSYSWSSNKLTTIRT